MKYLIRNTHPTVGKTLHSSANGCIQWIVLSILISFLNLTYTVVLSQSKTDSLYKRPANSFNVNLLGDASIVSCSYERLFYTKSNFFIAAKLGVGYSKEFRICFGRCTTRPNTYLTIPHHLTMNLGKRTSFLEIGIGGTKVSSLTFRNYLLYPIIGYRYQPIRINQASFRISIHVPVIGRNKEEDVLFSPFGFNLGVCF
ncbi:MAG TPA: hypothetical protein VI603_18405 [Saprospiraceae bacterium]|nr:hypothetical protein [Saprospiraceae bacterium]